MHPHPIDLELAVRQRQVTAERWACERMLLRHARSAAPSPPEPPPTWPQLLVATGAAVEPHAHDLRRSSAVVDVVTELGRILTDAGIDAGVPAPVDGEAPVVTLRRLGRLAERTAGRTVPVEARQAARVERLLLRLATADGTGPMVAAPAAPSPWRSALNRLNRLNRRHRPAQVRPRCP